MHCIRVSHDPDHQTHFKGHYFSITLFLFLSLLTSIVWREGGSSLTVTMLRLAEREREKAGREGGVN